MSVDLSRTMGPSILALPFMALSSSHQLVVGASDTIRIASILVSLSIRIACGIARTGGKTQALSPHRKKPGKSDIGSDLT